ncbi:hypothetical protein GCM10010353_70820 [Streptomyces chryseus]|nr:hypothetical protein GCM10010353_70820 [Streptomyces chryseus]
MESMGKKKPRPRRSFTAEFKAEIVELCRRGDRSVGQVAKDFDLTETAVRDWVEQAEVDAGERDGLTSSEREELAAPRRENRRLRADVDILKAGHGFLREGDPVTVHPFIEAEKQSNHNVKRACELLKVSRTAFYARRNGTPGPRAPRSGADREDHRSPRALPWHLRGPACPCRPATRGRRMRTAPRRQVDAGRWTSRPSPQAATRDHPPRPAGRRQA